MRCFLVTPSPFDHIIGNGPPFYHIFLDKPHDFHYILIIEVNISGGTVMNNSIRIAGGMQNPDARRDIFISYRREGGDDFAHILDEYLLQHSYSVFWDIDDLRSGKFNEKLIFFIDNCIDFILILPKGALDRCDSPTDWLRMEIEAAIKSGRNIIPIMLKGFQWPDPSTLPESLQNLHVYNALQQPNNEYFGASMLRLIDMLHAKPRFLNVVLDPPSPPPPPKISLFAKSIIAIVVLAMVIVGTMFAQRLLYPLQADVNATASLVNAASTQAPQVAATQASVYAKGFIQGSAIDTAVRALLGIPSGELLLADVESIREIKLSCQSLTDISELSALSGLITLDLHNNQISDLGPLASLVGLETLLIYNNRISSLQPLSALHNLTELSAENNQIIDVSPLATLTALQKLYLQNNQIVDVSPLRNLTNLTRLVLDNNPITDFTPLRTFDTMVLQIPQPT